MNGDYLGFVASGTPLGQVPGTGGSRHLLRPGRLAGSATRGGAMVEVAHRVLELRGRALDRDAGGDLRHRQDQHRSGRQPPAGPPLREL